MMDELLRSVGEDVEEFPSQIFAKLTIIRFDHVLIYTWYSFLYESVKSNKNRCCTIRHNNRGSSIVPSHHYNSAIGKLDKLSSINI